MKTTHARIMDNIRFCLTLVALLFMLHLAAVDGFATPLTWTLGGVTFVDGAKASGSFIFDATTDTYSGIDITTTNGQFFPGATFVATLAFSATFVEVFPPLSADLTGSPVMLLAFASALTDAGGTIALIPGAPGPVGGGSSYMWKRWLQHCRAGRLHYNWFSYC